MLSKCAKWYLLVCVPLCSHFLLRLQWRECFSCLVNVSSLLLLLFRVRCQRSFGTYLSSCFVLHTFHRRHMSPSFLFNHLVVSVTASIMVVTVRLSTLCIRSTQQLLQPVVQIIVTCIVPAVAVCSLPLFHVIEFHWHYDRCSFYVG